MSALNVLAIYDISSFLTTVIILAIIALVLSIEGRR